MHTLLLGLDLLQSLGGVGRIITKVMLPFTTEVLNMHCFYSFCIYSSFIFFIVPYRRLKTKF